MKYEKYLPLGSVVLLKGGKKRVMVAGFCAISDEDKDKVYDYSGCVYPEGFMSSSQVLLFDHDQIDKVYYLGLSDDEDKEFKTKLKKLMENK